MIDFPLVTVNILTFNRKNEVLQILFFKYRSRLLAFAILKGYIDSVRGDFSNSYLKKLPMNKK